MYPTPGDHVLMGLLVAGARLASLMMPVADLANLADRVASEIGDCRPPEKKVGRRVEDTASAAVQAGLLARRAARVVPGANCLHRAAAARIWLGVHGVPSQILIGFRKREGLEGHAWLELDGDDGPIRLFVSEDDGYRAIWESRST